MGGPLQPVQMNASHFASILLSHITSNFSPSLSPSLPLALSLSLSPSGSLSNLLTSDDFQRESRNIMKVTCLRGFNFDFPEYGEYCTFLSPLSFSPLFLSVLPLPPSLSSL